MALERELRDARRSLSDANPIVAPSTSATSVEGPVVVVMPTPTGPAICPLPLHLTLPTISLRASGSDIAEHQVYP